MGEKNGDKVSETITRMITQDHVVFEDRFS